eukprot:122860-Pyramimonas_sp.AAC.1
MSAAKLLFCRSSSSSRARRVTMPNDGASAATCGPQSTRGPVEPNRRIKRLGEGRAQHAQAKTPLIQVAESKRQVRANWLYVEQLLRVIDT